MITEYVAEYAVRNNLPFEFMGWVLDTFGYDAGDYPSIETIHREWSSLQD